MESTKSPIPNILNYNNLLIYLNDYFKYRKSNDSGFTYEQWSQELGFQSTALMYLVCKNQRNMTTGTVEALAKYQKMSQNEKNHLFMLANYEQAKSDEVKSALYDKILENFKYPEKNLEADEYAMFMTSKTLPMIKMILSYDDATGTKEEIKKIIDISDQQLKDDLNQLESLGLIKKISDTTWKATDKAIRFPDNKNTEIMQAFHKKNLEESIEANTQEDIFKKFRGLILAIDPNEYSGLENEIEQFICKLKNKYAHNHLNKKQLFKLNLQAFQASRTKSIN